MVVQLGGNATVVNPSLPTYGAAVVVCIVEEVVPDELPDREDGLEIELELAVVGIAEIVLLLARVWVV